MDKTAIIQYDELKNTLETGWWVEIDGEDYFFAESRCSIDEDDKTIEAPLWMIEVNNLEDYIID